MKRSDTPGAADAVLAKRANQFNFQCSKTYHSFAFCWKKFKDIFGLPQFYYRELDMALFIERDNYIFPLPRSESDLIRRFLIAVAKPWGDQVNESNYNQVIHGVLQNRWHTSGNPLGEEVKLANVHSLPSEIKLCVMYFLLGLRMNSQESDYVDHFYNNSGVQAQEIGQDAAGNRYHYFGEGRIVAELKQIPLYKHTVDDDILATAPWKDTYRDHTSHPSFVIATPLISDYNELVSAFDFGTEEEQQLANKLRTAYNTEIEIYQNERIEEPKENETNVVDEDPSDDDDNIDEMPQLEREGGNTPIHEQPLVGNRAETIEVLRVISRPNQQRRQNVRQQKYIIHPAPRQQQRTQLRFVKTGITVQVMTPAERFQYRFTPPPTPVTVRLAPAQMSPKTRADYIQEHVQSVIDGDSVMIRAPVRPFRVTQEAAERPAPPKRALPPIEHEPIEPKRTRRKGFIPRKYPQLYANPKIYILREEEFREADFQSYYSCFKPTIEEIPDIVKYTDQLRYAQRRFGHEFDITLKDLYDRDICWIELHEFVDVLFETVMQKKTDIIQEFEYFMTSCYGNEKRTQLVEGMTRFVLGRWDSLFPDQIQEDELCKKLLRNMWGYVLSMLPPELYPEPQLNPALKELPEIYRPDTVK